MVLERSLFLFVEIYFLVLTWVLLLPQLPKPRPMTKWEAFAQTKGKFRTSSISPSIMLRVLLADRCWFVCFGL